MHVIVVFDANGGIFSVIGPFLNLAAAKAYNVKNAPKDVKVEVRILTAPVGR